MSYDPIDGDPERPTKEFAGLKHLLDPEVAGWVADSTATLTQDRVEELITRYKNTLDRLADE